MKLQIIWNIQMLIYNIQENKVNKNNISAKLMLRKHILKGPSSRISKLSSKEAKQWISRVQMIKECQFTSPEYHISVALSQKGLTSHPQNKIAVLFSVRWSINILKPIRRKSNFSQLESKWKVTID